MIVLKILVLVLWLVVFPILVGLVPIHFMNNVQKTFSKAIILGYLASFALLEFIGIPIVLCITYYGYSIFIGMYIVTMLFVAGLGAYITRKDIIHAHNNDDTETFSLKHRFRNVIADFKSSSLESKIYMGIIALLFIFQIVMALRMASYDVDDAYYNTYATTAQKYGTLYRTDPNTGKSIPLDMRHGLALFPIFQAFVSSLSHIHLLIIAHKVMPIIVIALSYILVYEIAKLLFPHSKEQSLMFLLLINVFRLFGNVSEYTTETFFFLRTWQGKALAGNFIIPAIIWLYLLMMNDRDNPKGHRYWSFILITLLASGASSSLAVLLCCMLDVILGGIFAIRDKNIKTFLKALLSCGFGAIYILIYVIF